MWTGYLSGSGSSVSNVPFEDKICGCEDGDGMDMITSLIGYLSCTTAGWLVWS